MIEIRKLTIEARVPGMSSSPTPQQGTYFSSQQIIKTLPDAVVSYLVQEVIRQLRRQKEDR